MSSSFRVALVQFTAGSEVGPNVATVGAYVRQAKDKGADFVLTPENTGFMEKDDAARLAKAEPEESHRALDGLRKHAVESGVWLLIGSLSVRLPGQPKVANRSFLLDPAGAIVARYDKIHLFDVDLPGRESYRESNTFAPGGRAVVADLPWGRLGLSVCYDLRFPHLHRALAQAGAEFIAVPSAFTVPTGRAHWHVLLRARAIECGAYVFAPAQTGTHANGRGTFGHSLVVSPWGEVLADGGEAPGLVLAEIDPAKVAEARAAVPSLGHDRAFAPPD